ncbi:ubiquinol-cytochrome c reductase cytochrome c1 subunit [Ferrimonas sediminum]|uniref:Ubiquinol-cytochrome c reductase cytochrome c1 subunit n=1 Tax=Ferrimonas sediminum TaxID=718193 RepID=A0A1G8KE67_9GAMM|nr:cytochrome c1 [Ferrimonas sediminum]SDI41712.1 ubiquinol-cytochrome c reductase cytochrome c1 subunit [Ferrimonas sediminum]
MKKVIAVLMACLPALVFAAGGNNEHVVSANIDLTDKASLKRGAQAFMDNCSGCHSLQYQRYQRIADDLEMTEEEVSNLILSDVKVGEQIKSAMSSDNGATWFGAPPPDLTLEARLKSPDWIYSYLKSFYVDESRPFGVNNLVFPAVGMPHVLEGLQGTPVLQEDGTIVASGGQMNAEEYDQYVLDITNFLTYTGEPVKLERERIGKWVLAFLAFFFVIAFFLKKEYWRDVH